MKQAIIVGEGRALERADSTARERGLEHRVLEVEIGQGSTLGAGSVALADTRVGRHCEWLLPGRLPRELPNYSFYDELMPDGARIL